MNDMFSILEGLKNKMEEESGYVGEVDTTGYMETLNPSLSSDSKKYNDSDKIIFKERISEEHSDDIIEIVNDIDKYEMNSLNEYKRKIINKCNLIITLGENPIEILVYATKGLYGKELYINAVKDCIKSLYEDNESLIVRAYKNILKSWTWIDCLELVLKSTTEIGILDLAEEVYGLFEQNAILRELSAQVLISVDAENYYHNIINYLCNQPNDTQADIEIIRHIFYTMAKKNNNSTNMLFDAFIKYNIKPNIRGVVIGAIRFNLSLEILEKCERYLKNPQTSSQTANKIVRLLGKAADRNKKALAILKDALRYPHINKKDINMVLVRVDEEARLSIANNTSLSQIERVNALVSLGQNNKIEDIEMQLREASQESEILDAVVCSIRIENKDYRHMIKLFQYIATKDEYDSVSIEATNQIKRLRTLKDEQLISNLHSVAERMLDNDDIVRVKKVLKVIDIFQSGISNDEIALMFNKKLNSTSHSVVQEKILEFYKRDFHRFSENVRNVIRKSVLECTRDPKVKDSAMECLAKINSFSDFTPVV
ncbi:MAG: hypothetical protein Q4F66_05490 [Clostridium sp.]|nr:hypothetical protein [Clostridium sp.]